MAQNITIAGASYSAVPSIQVPKTGSGTATFVDTSDANAGASDIMSGKTAYVNGTKVTGTASGGYQVGIISRATSATMQTAVFDGLLGEPVAFATFMRSIKANATSSPYASSTSYVYVGSWAYDGTANNVVLWTRSNANYPITLDNRSTVYSFSYSSGTLTLNITGTYRFFGQSAATSTTGYWYELMYIY